MSRVSAVPLGASPRGELLKVRPPVAQVAPEPSDHRGEHRHGHDRPGEQDQRRDDVDEGNGLVADRDVVLLERDQLACSRGPNGGLFRNQA